MRPFPPATVALFVALLPATVRADDGWVPLFNGKDLTGWTATAKPAKGGEPVDPLKTWSVKDGLLVCYGKPNGYLATVKEYGEYELRVKWRFPADAKAGNSGVLLHVTGPDRYWPHSVEAQMKAGFAGDLWLNPDEKGVLPTLDLPAGQFDAADPSKRHYFRLDRKDAGEKPLGEWNEYAVTCKGGDITLAVNGRVVNVAKNGALTRGRIGLQSEGSEVHFKDVEHRPLK